MPKAFNSIPPNTNPIPKHLALNPITSRIWSFKIWSFRVQAFGFQGLKFWGIISFSVAPGFTYSGFIELCVGKMISNPNPVPIIRPNTNLIPEPHNSCHSWNTKLWKPNPENSAPSAQPSGAREAVTIILRLWNTGLSFFWIWVVWRQVMFFAFLFQQSPRGPTQNYGTTPRLPLWWGKKPRPRPTPQPHGPPTTTVHVLRQGGQPHQPTNH